MKYITINDLSHTIRTNLWKIPRDIDFIIGIPRSGLMCAAMICSYLNVPLIDIDAYCAGRTPYGGSRLRHFRRTHAMTGKALVVDDTVWDGNAMREAKKKLSQRNDGMKLTYMCVYLEGRAHDVVDLFLEDVRPYTNNFTTIVFYEWNIFQHNEDHTTRYLSDIDGVLCQDPPDERDEDAYMRHITTARPLFIPRNKIGCLITFRLEKNRAVTEQWLRTNGVIYGNLHMFPAMTWQQRYDSGISPARFKGDYYKTHKEYDLFIESDDRQARQIAQITGKPVYSVETNSIYQ